MAQYIKNANIWGRIGSGVGQGLAEQLPKEMEHQRLRSGLKELASKSGQLSPEEYMAEAGGIYGISPQMIQSMGELAKMQRKGAAFQQAAGKATDRQTQAKNINEQFESQIASNEPMPKRQPANLQKASFAYTPKALSNREAQANENVGREEFGQPQVAPRNPLNEELRPFVPWTPQQRNMKIAEYVSSGFTPDQAVELARDDESRERAGTESIRNWQSELEGRQDQLQKKLKSDVEQKLQKSGEGVYKDISGDMLKNLARGAERDLRLDPNASPSDVAQKWSNKALELARTNNDFQTLARTTGIESYLKGNETYDKLKTYSKIYKDADNSYEYYKNLQSEFDFSPQAAAEIAYGISPKIEKTLNDYKKIAPKSGNLGSSYGFNFERSAAPEMKVASDVIKNIQHNDSILAIAYKLKKQNSFFNEKAFFDQLRFEMEDSNLNDRQKQEIAVGESGWGFKWGDIFVMPGKL